MAKTAIVVKYVFSHFLKIITYPKLEEANDFLNIYELYAVFVHEKNVSKYISILNFIGF